MRRVEDFLHCEDKPRKVRLFHEGATKRIYETENPNRFVIEYSDEVELDTSSPESSKVRVSGRAEMASKITSLFFAYLKVRAVRNHFVGLYSDNSILVRRARPLPFYIIVRRYVGYELSRKLGLPSSLYLNVPLVDFHLKEKNLRVPFVSEEQLLLATGIKKHNLKKARRLARGAFVQLESLFDKCGFRLYDVRFAVGYIAGGYGSRKTKHGLALIEDILPEDFTAVDTKTGFVASTRPVEAAELPVRSAQGSAEDPEKRIFRVYELVFERLQKVLGVRL